MTLFSSEQAGQQVSKYNVERTINSSINSSGASKQELEKSNVSGV